jgi:alkylhydroperoxidase/carboxymuconolactone decarboxylase family protein YurZ
MTNARDAQGEPMTIRNDADTVWDYIASYYTDADTVESFRLLVKHRPGVVRGYTDLRRDLFEGEDQAIPGKYKELIIIAMECIARKVNPAPLFHARKAVDAGASLAEITEAVCLALMIGGMITYQEAGQHVLKEAERYLAEKGDEAQKG